MTKTILFMCWLSLTDVDGSSVLIEAGQIRMIYSQPNKTSTIGTIDGVLHVKDSIQSIKHQLGECL